MTEGIDFETYLVITPYQFKIYLFDKKKLNYLYNQTLNFDYKEITFDANSLILFLEDNIFKIEKLIGKFIKNIFLVIDSNEISSIDIGIQRKNYQELIDKDFLKILLKDATDLFRENYPEKKIMHVMINKYMIDGKHYQSFKENIIGDYLSIEIKYIFINNQIVSEFDKVLRKFQINVVKYLDCQYIQNFLKMMI